jgi:hypothetical protein
LNRLLSTSSKKGSLRERRRTRVRLVNRTAVPLLKHATWARLIARLPTKGKEGQLLQVSPDQQIM